MAEKRTRFLGIRVTEDEYEQLLDRCDHRRLASWMRETCLGEKPARSGKLPSIAPPLLRQLAGMGNNLNQIARKINSETWTGHDRVHVVSALMAIEAQLTALRHTVSSPEAEDDC